MKKNLKNEKDYHLWLWPKYVSNVKLQPFFPSYIFKENLCELIKKIEISFQCFT
jgi:hypothetical protein